MTTYQIKLQPTRMLAISESGQTCDFVYHCRGACYSSFMAYIHLQGGPKTAQFFWYALTSSNINRFSKLFHCQNQEKICSNIVSKDPTTRKVIVTSCRSSAGILHGCLRQNGAPSHTARNAPTYLRRENVTFIEPHMWHPYSPDLNPVHCAV